jgi:hypothetical protein
MWIDSFCYCSLLCETMGPTPDPNSLIWFRRGPHPRFGRKITNGGTADRSTAIHGTSTMHLPRFTGPGSDEVLIRRTNVFFRDLLPAIAYQLTQVVHWLTAVPNKVSHGYMQLSIGLTAIIYYRVKHPTQFSETATQFRAWQIEWFQIKRECEKPSRV